MSNLWPGVAGGKGCVVVVVVQLSPDELLNVFRLGVSGGETLPKSAKGECNCKHNSISIPVRLSGDLHCNLDADLPHFGQVRVQP